MALRYQIACKCKKPWEIHHADTLDLWKFGDYKHYTGLDLLAEIFQLKSSKDDIDGSEVNRVYHIEKNLARIATYCAKDVVVLAQLYLKMNVLPVFDDENVFLV
jgi:3'-5' exonuclease